MNIAFISYWSCPLTKLGVLDSGGMSVYLLNLANELARLGHTVDIFTRSHDRTDVDEFVPNGRVNIIHLPQKEPDLYADTHNFAQEIVAYAKNKNIKYDIFHSHYFYSGLVGLDLQKIYRLPHVFTFHSLGRYEQKDDRITTRKRIEAEDKIVKNVDALIVSTEAELESIKRTYQGNKDKIYIVSPGIDHNIFKQLDKREARKTIGIPTELKVILYIGRIDANKGVSFLIEAVSILASKYPSFANNFRVIIIGGDTESDAFWQNKEIKKLRTLIEEKDLACCVKFIGTKYHSELPVYYCAANLFVLPSIHESFGFVVLEAMASGTAVIASKVGGLRYLVTDGETGRFFRRGDASDLSEKIWELLNDDKQRIKLEKNALLESQKYCWSKQAVKIIEIYNKLISK